MAKHRINHLLFFLLTIIPVQYIFPTISSPGDYLPLSWGANSDPKPTCYRVYHAESSENYGHIINLGNVKVPIHRVGLPGHAVASRMRANEISFFIVPLDPTYKAGLSVHLPGILYRLSRKPSLQMLRDLRGYSLAKNYLGKSLSNRYTTPIAQTITPNPLLKATMRTTITPLVLLSKFLVATTLTDKIVYLLFLVCYSLCIFSWLIKKHPDI